MRRAYQWSAPDQIAAIVDRHTGKATHYEHDPRGYLIKQILAEGTEIHRAADPAGNLFKTPERRDRNYGRGGVIKRADGTHYKVDDDGFLTQKTLSDGATWKYTWDAHGRLREVERPDKKKVAFTYDAFGRRTTKTFDGKTTEFVWDGDDLVHERIRDAGGTVASPVTTWVFEPGMFTPLAKLEGRKRFGIVTDHLGTPAILTTEAGAIAWRAQLDVYGVVREEEGVARDEDRTANPWRFPGQYEDAETGLYYNRFRYYDPELGRYLSEDPICLWGGLGLYSYAPSSLALCDPLGLSCKVQGIHNDTLTKGVHINAPNGVELRVLPGNGSTIVFKPVFSTTPARAVREAIDQAAEELKSNPNFRKKLHDTAQNATRYLVDNGMPGKSAETRSLAKTLEKMGW